MSKKSGMEHIASAAKTAKAFKDIVKAFLKGGWQAAFIQSLKHYWPQVLTISLIFFLLPVIVFCCLPAMLFGFGDSTDTEISALNIQASNVSSYYDKYEEYCIARISEIKTSVTGNSSQSENKDETEKITYEITVAGEAMAKNWLISLHSVSVGNNLNAMDEQNVKDFIGKSIVYTVEDKPQKTENTESSANSNTDQTAEANNKKDKAKIKLLKIYYLTPLEFMEKYGYSDADRNWVQLMYRTLQEDEIPVGGVLGTPFPSTQWKNSITSEYGYRTEPKSEFHSGLDIGMPMGTEIYAVKSGTVKKAESGTSGYGYHIIIEHGNGLETLYAHCSELCVEVGQEVGTDTVIAKIGSTGDSTGPHLHIEIRINEKTVDPFAYLS